MMNTTDFFNYPTGGQPSSISPQNLSFWPNQSAADWRKLLSFGSTNRYKKGETVLPAGQTLNSFTIVSFGRFQMGDTIFNEGEVFGIESFFAEQPYPFSVVALEDGEVVAVTRTAFDSLTAREPHLAKHILFELGRLAVISKNQ
ncbi:MAG: cyclic nucleotide-binding domain-containing protein [Chloroflexota bacterium]